MFRGLCSTWTSYICILGQMVDGRTSKFSRYNNKLWARKDNKKYLKDRGKNLNGCAKM